MTDRERMLERARSLSAYGSTGLILVDVNDLAAALLEAKAEGVKWGAQKGAGQASERGGK